MIAPFRNGMVTVSMDICPTCGLCHTKVLSDPIMDRCMSYAWRRENENRQRKTLQNRGNDGKCSLDKNINGVCSETVVQLWTNSPIKGKGQFREADVDDYMEVRSSIFPDAHLILNPNSRRDRLHWLVTGEYNTWTLRGWIAGYDVTPAMWKTPPNQRGECYWIDQSELKPPCKWPTKAQWEAELLKRGIKHGAEIGEPVTEEEPLLI